jgi:hypothetical protein
LFSTLLRARGDELLVCLCGKHAVDSGLRRVEDCLPYQGWGFEDATPSNLG